MARRSIVSVAAVTAALLMAGCSSSGSSSTGSTSAQGSSSGSPGASGTAIKVGALIPVGGPIYNSPGSLAAIQAAFKQLNATGGIAGRPLSLDWCNDQDDPNMSQQCIRKFASDKVVAMLGSSSVTSGPADIALINQEKIPNVDWLPFTPAEYSSPYTFVYTSTDLALAGATVALAKKLGATSDVVVRVDTPDEVDIAPMIGEMGGAAGLSKPPEVLIPLTGVSDFSSYAQKVIASGAKVVSLGVTAQEAIGLITALHQLGAHPTIVLTGGTLTESDLAGLGAAAAGVYIVNATPGIHDTKTVPGMASFVNAMKAESSSGNTNANLPQSLQLITDEWVASFAVADVLKQMAKAGTQINAANFFTAFSSAKNLDTGGVAVPWSPSHHFTKVPGYSDLSNTDIYLLEASGNGQLALVQPTPVDYSTFFAG